MTSTYEGVGAALAVSEYQRDEDPSPLCIQDISKKPRSTLS